MKHINEENLVVNCKTKDELLLKVEEVQAAMMTAAEQKLLRRKKIKRNFVISTRTKELKEQKQKHTRTGERIT